MMTVRSFFKQHKVHCLAFLVPVLMMGIGFAVNGIFPFGSRQILVTDFYHQYYPFFLELREILHSGGSLLWSWRAGVGANFLAIISYYLASPLNLIAVLFPASLAREALTLMLLMKVGCAGLCMSLFLRGIYDRDEMAMLPFSFSYALCAFSMGYYWNIMWMDTFSIFPLVMLGLYRLVTKGDFVLYTLTLALAIFMNFYIGFFVCIFTAIAFFCICIVRRIKFLHMLTRMLRVGLHSAIAIGLTAPLTLSAWMALAKSYSASGKPPTPDFRLGWAEMLGNLISFGQPSAKEGLPNVASGLLILLLVCAFLWSRRVWLLEKLLTVGLIVFLLASCSFSTLDYIWHGFHMTNMIPYRFTFLLSFVLSTVGYKAWLLLEEDGFDRGDWLSMALLGLAVHLCALFGKSQLVPSVAASTVVAACYIPLLMARNKNLKRLGKVVRLKRQVTGRHVLSVLVGLEFLATGIIGVTTVQTTSRTAYPAAQKDVAALLAMHESMEQGQPFSRIETTANFISNDPMLYGYHGVSFFCSTANVSVTHFLEALGHACWVSGNRYYYAESTPLSNALLGVKYLFSRDGSTATPGYWQRVGASGEATLYRNTAALPFGFMVRGEMRQYTPGAETGFANQNELFQALTGLEETPLFTSLDMVHVGHRGYHVTRTAMGRYHYKAEEGEDSAVESEDRALKWNYQMPHDGLLFIQVNLTKGETVQIYPFDEPDIAVTHKVDRPVVICCGSYQAGDIVSCYFPMGDDAESGSVQIHAATFDNALFDRGIASLNNTLVLDSFEDTEVTGHIDVRQEGLLYTSLPYEKGWRANVDGQEVDIVPMGGLMAMLPLTPGRHDVRLWYWPDGLTAGLLIFAASLAAFVMLCLLYRIKPSFFVVQTPPYLRFAPLPSAEQIGEDGVLMRSPDAENHDGGKHDAE